MEKLNKERIEQFRKEHEMKTNHQARTMNFKDYCKFRLKEINKYYHGKEE